MIWLTVKETANLLSYVERTIRKKAANREFKSRYISSSAGQGGRKMEILLESLPEQAQQAYHNQQGTIQPVINTENTFTTKAQKEKGQKRAECISQYRKYYKQCIKNGVTKKTEIQESFMVKWNSENPDFQRTVKSLRDWLSKTKMGDIEKLVDKRGGYNRGQSSIPDKYKIYFESLYLQETRPTIEVCFRETKLYANRNGDVLPGIKAFRLYVKNMNESLLTRAREGKKAFDDKCMPYIERDYSKLFPNDWWVSDHHLWDIFVRVPDGIGGWKLERPWGSYWMDMRTRKMMSSVIRTESPNSDIVLCSFGLGVEQFGIPKGVRLDNGKDYKAKDLFYEDRYICSRDEEEKVFSSLATNLQVTTTYAIAYNAKAKPIERVFSTYEEQLGKKYPSYAGSDAKQRPENLKDLDIMDVITLEEFIEHHNQYVYEIYNNSPHSGDSMFSKTPNQVWNRELAEHRFTIRKVSKDVLYFSLMRVKGTRVVGRNGITFNKTHFYNDNCINFIGQKVIAKYDPTKPEILYIFDINENYLFVAEEIQKQGWELTDEDYQKENHRKKLARQKALNKYTADNVIRSTKSIGERLEIQAESVEKTPIEIPTKIEIVRNPKIEENVKRIALSDVERNYQDILDKQKNRKREGSERQQKMADRFKKNMLERAKKNQA